MRTHSCKLLCLALLLFQVTVAGAASKQELKELGKQLVSNLENDSSRVSMADRCSLNATFAGTAGDLVISRGYGSSLMFGDKVMSVDGATDGLVVERLATIAPDAEIELEVLRDGQQKTITGKCTDVTEFYDLQRQLGRALAKSNFNDCIKINRKLENLAGVSGSSRWYGLQCSIKLNEKSDGWARSTFPKEYYKNATIVLKTNALLAEHDQGPALDEHWPNVLLQMTDLTNWGFGHLATDLERQYNQKVAEMSVAGNSAPPSAGAGKKVASQGSCFSIRPDGYVVTNYHVIDGGVHFNIELSDGREYPASLHATSQSTDLAILKIDAKGIPYLPLSSVRSAKIGMEVFTIGFPATGILGTDAKFTDGVVSALSGLQGEASLLQVSVPIQPGNSGGPLVNLSGEVVGIMTSTAAAEYFFKQTGALPQNVNWAVKSDYVRLLIDGITAPEAAADRQQAIDRTMKAACRVTATS